MTIVVTNSFPGHPTRANVNQFIDSIISYLLMPLTTPVNDLT